MAKAKKRADGRYCTQIYLGRDEAGKKRYKSVYAKSPAELKDKEAAVRLQFGRGTRSARCCTCPVWMWCRLAPRWGTPTSPPPFGFTPT